MLSSKITQVSNTVSPAPLNHSLALSYPTAPAEAGSSPSSPQKLTPPPPDDIIQNILSGILDSPVKVTLPLGAGNINDSGYIHPSIVLSLRIRKQLIGR